jgi:hypothetical protein
LYESTYSGVWLEKKSGAFLARLEPFDGRERNSTSYTTSDLRPRTAISSLCSECGRTSTKYLVLAQSHLRHANSARKGKPPWDTTDSAERVPRSPPTSTSSVVSYYKLRFLGLGWGLDVGCQELRPAGFCSWASGIDQRLDGHNSMPQPDRSYHA